MLQAHDARLEHPANPERRQHRQHYRQQGSEYHRQGQVLLPNTKARVLQESSDCRQQPYDVKGNPKPYQPRDSHFPGPQQAARGKSVAQQIDHGADDDHRQDQRNGDVQQMDGLVVTLQHPAADQQQDEGGRREQFTIHPANADPHGFIGIVRDLGYRPAAHIPCDLPGDEQRKHDDHDLPKDQAALQVVEQFGNQAPDFGLVFHFFSR